MLGRYLDEQSDLNWRTDRDTSWNSNVHADRKHSTNGDYHHNHAIRSTNADRDADTDFDAVTQPHAIADGLTNADAESDSDSGAIHGQRNAHTDS